MGQGVTNKMWMKEFEFMSYASCFGSADHTMPHPDYSQGGQVANPAVAVDICRRCRVRPECAAWASKGEHGVWAAGRYIPGHDEDKATAQRVRDELAESVALERQLRGPEI